MKNWGLATEADAVVMFRDLFSQIFTSPTCYARSHPPPLHMGLFVFPQTNVAFRVFRTFRAMPSVQ